LKTATVSFENIAEIDIRDATDNWVCIFDAKADAPLSLIVKEFENYVIDLINSEKMYERN